MYIEETTIKERIAISNAITPIFVDLERAENLLDTIQDECFEFKGGARISLRMQNGCTTWSALCTTFCVILSPLSTSR